MIMCSDKDVERFLRGNERFLAKSELYQGMCNLLIATSHIDNLFEALKEGTCLTKCFK